MSPTTPMREGSRICACSRTSCLTTGFVHGAKPSSIDAGIYGFIANIYFLDIDTPLKEFVVAHPNLVRHCTEIHAALR